MSVASRLRERERFERVRGVKLGADVKLWRVRQDVVIGAAPQPRTIAEKVLFSFGALAGFALLCAQDLAKGLKQK